MCGLCGTLGGRDWTDGVASGAASVLPRERRAARRARVVAASRVLAVSGLALEDFQGSVFLLRARTGAAVPVASLLDAWAAADRLGRPIDPLDPAVHARLA